MPKTALLKLEEVFQSRIMVHADLKLFLNGMTGSCRIQLCYVKFSF